MITLAQTVAGPFTVAAQNLQNPDLLLLFDGDGQPYCYNAIERTSTRLDLVVAAEWLFDARDLPTAA